MTALQRPVRRTTNLGGRRPVVVTLDPNGGHPLLSFRIHRCRGSVSLPLQWCLLQAHMRAAEQYRAERRARRRK